MPLPRRFALLLPALALAGCGGGAATQSFPPLRYDYLTPIRLNVASIEIEDRAPEAGGRRDATAISPARPAEALRQMAQDRLQALGAAGRAVFVITEASLTRDGDVYQGALAVELDVYADGAVRSGFADARTYRRREDDGDDARAILYGLIRQMMDAMNVEFEYQVRKRLADYVTTGTAPPPAPVEQEPLAPPS